MIAIDNMRTKMVIPRVNRNKYELSLFLQGIRHQGRLIFVPVDPCMIADNPLGIRHHAGCETGLLFVALFIYRYYWYTASCGRKEIVLQYLKTG